MHRRIVQRIFGLSNTDKSSTLLVGFFAQTRHLFQLTAAREWPIFAAVLHDVFGQFFADATYVTQQVFAGGIYIYSHRIHAAHHGIVQFFFEFGLVDVVLVLAYTNGFGINFNQLGQRIGQAAANRNSPTNGHVIIRKFVAGNFGCRVHRSAGFTHHKYLYRLVKGDFFNEKFGFPRSSSVANSNGFNSIGICHRTYFFHRQSCVVLRRMWINGFVVQ